MTQLWPRISTPRARTFLAEIPADGDVRDLARTAGTEHPDAIYPATGGHRVDRRVVADLAAALRTTATNHGYPDPTTDAERIRFDRAAAQVVYSHMRITTVEAASRGVWNFLALVAIPDVTRWRFGRSNTERWIASDLTRHMFARLWWQALTFAAAQTPTTVDDYTLLRRLSERDLNQITERRRIAGNPRLARAIAAAALDSPAGTDQVLRTVTPRLRRLIPFIDFSALTDDQIRWHIGELLRRADHPPAGPR
jgi:hypothetical protein